VGSIGVLLVGELQRMLRYHILGAGFVVALIWLLVLHFTEVIGVATMLPLLLFFDATSMAIILVGVTLFFEKQEGTIRSLQVSPINRTEQIMAKILGNILTVVQTLVILYLYAWFFKEIKLSFVALLLAVILIGVFHSLVGFLLTYRARGFTELLMGMFVYFFAFMFPVVFEQIGLIQNEVVRGILYLLPTKASLILLNASAGGIEAWEVYFSAFYLVAVSGLLFYYVLKRFNEFALKESGV
jgi:fluoroquinolone transport system permease protein